MPGIGKDLVGKIAEMVRTGSLGQLEDLQGKTPPGLSQLMKVEGLGPKRVKVLNQELGVSTLKGLEEAAQEEPPQ